MKPIPKVGDRLYSLNVGNAARHTEQKLTPVDVIKVGRKYFTCKSPSSWFECEYKIEDWSEKTEYIADSALYASREEWEEDKARRASIDYIYKCVRDYDYFQRLTTDELRTVQSILLKHESKQ